MLIVEDDDCELFVAAFAARWQVARAWHGRGGVQALSRLSGLVAATVDLGLPDGVGWWVVREVRRRFPGAPVAVVTGFWSQRLQAEAYRLGAEYLCKGSCLTTTLPFFIRRLVARELGVDQQLWEYVGAVARSHRLSEREMEVLALVSQGRRRKEIAGRLGISEETVKSYARSVTEKLDIERLKDFGRDLQAMALGGNALDGSNPATPLTPITASMFLPAGAAEGERGGAPARRPRSPDPGRT